MSGTMTDVNPCAQLVFERAGAASAQCTAPPIGQKEYAPQGMLIPRDMRHPADGQPESTLLRWR
jgi:hypothetical protein